MNITLEQLAGFLGWCSAIHIGILLFASLWIRFAPELTRRSQRLMFPTLTDEQLDVAVYGYLAVYKALFVVLNLVPYLVLRFFVL